MNKLKNNLTPLLIAIGIVLGIVVGSFISSRYAGKRLNIINSSSNKVKDLFHLIEDEYVDTVDMSELVEKSMPEILKLLDPHSSYIRAKDVENTMTELRGSFSGIGVQFTIYKDTVRIIRVIKGGPSESVGLRSGDRIIKIDNKPYIGSIVNNEETIKRLKGPLNSHVKLEVVRIGNSQPLNFEITRGDVPVNSITAAYVQSDSIGYIRLNNFGETTYAEFLAALAKLNQQNFKSLVLDLRGNLGGYMDPAVQIAKEFLPKGQLIVYTEGRKSPKQAYYSDGRGTFQHLPLVILVDETSASASEILAGAIQDNDRGTIVGRRSFGKGLVQVPIQFDDGSMIRLTKARYYTPSGRCVQKPYTPGEEAEYESDLLLRASHGEYQHADSIKTRGEKYKTLRGRTVYGGGGIIPDLFIPEDTINMTSYFKEAYFKGLIFQYAYVFVDKNRTALEDCKNEDELISYISQKNITEEFAKFAEGEGLKRRNLLIHKSAPLFVRYLTANILDDIFDQEAALRYQNLSDPTLQAAIALLRNKKAFPLAPLTKDIVQESSVYTTFWKNLMLTHAYQAALFSKAISCYFTPADAFSNLKTNSWYYLTLPMS